MGGVKSIGMTAQAVATGDQALTNRQASGAAVGIMTAAAGIVHLRITIVSQRRWIAVTVAATRRINPDQNAVIRGIGRIMGDFPAIRMAGLAVATNSEVLAYRAAEQTTVARVVAVRAVGKMC